jgi:hypothetical protein
VTYPGFTPVGNATLVVVNVLTCNKHSPNKRKALPNSIDSSLQVLRTGQCRVSTSVAAGLQFHPQVNCTALTPAFQLFLCLQTEPKVFLDWKPENMVYDDATGLFVLMDFGFFQKLCPQSINDISHGYTPGELTSTQDVHRTCQGACNRGRLAGPRWPCQGALCVTTTQPC